MTQTISRTIKRSLKQTNVKQQLNKNYHETNATSEPCKTMTFRWRFVAFATQECEDALRTPSCIRKHSNIATWTNASRPGLQHSHAYSDEDCNIATLANASLHICYGCQSPPHPIQCPIASTFTEPCVLPAVSPITIIFLFAAFGPMRDVCGRIAVFEENVVADEGNCAFLCFGTSVGETQKHSLSPWFVICFMFSVSLKIQILKDVCGGIACFVCVCFIMLCTIETQKLTVSPWFVNDCMIAALCVTLKIEGRLR